MRDFGGMISFLAAQPEDAAALVTRTKLWILAESLGGVESLIEVPVAMTHASTADAPFAVPATSSAPPLGSSLRPTWSLTSSRRSPRSAQPPARPS